MVGLCLFAEVNGESRGIRVLGLFRGWRLLRLVSTVLKMKDRELERTKDEWEIDQQVPSPGRCGRGVVVTDPAVLVNRASTGA